MRLFRLTVAWIVAAIVLSACSSLAPPQRGYNQATLPSAQSPSAPLTVASRYQPAPTMSVLVVQNFAPGREAELMAIAKTECAGRSFCSVGFWNDEGLAPRRLKMSARELDGRIVQFAVNSRTGLSNATWNCQLGVSVVGNCS